MLAVLLAHAVATAVAPLLVARWGRLAFYPLALVPLGCGLMTLRLLIQFIAQLLSLATGRDLVPVRIGHGEGEHFE